MPNIADFKNKCAALGMDHIEVTLDFNDSEYFKEANEWKTFTVQSIMAYIRDIPLKIISLETYEHYKLLFAQTDIVFFVEKED